MVVTCNISLFLTEFSYPYKLFKPTLQKTANGNGKQNKAYLETYAAKEESC